MSDPIESATPTLWPVSVEIQLTSQEVSLLGKESAQRLERVGECETAPASGWRGDGHGYRFVQGACRARRKNGPQGTAAQPASARHAGRLPETAGRAQDYLAGVGLDAWCEVVGQSFFARCPPAPTSICSAASSMTGTTAPRSRSCAAAPRRAISRTNESPLRGADVGSPKGWPPSPSPSALRQGRAG
jgi:hypothetical protein